MQSSKAFKLWLGMQCQMLGNVSTAILVQASSHINPTSNSDSNQILAKWPHSNIDAEALVHAIQPVLEKQRLHLQILDSSQYLLGYPLIIGGKNWGALVCSLNIADKKELPGLLKHLKPGQHWLQFIVQLSSLELASLNDSSPSAETSVTVASLAAPSETPVTVPSFSPPIKETINAVLVQLNASLLKENSLQETCITFVNLLAGVLQATRVSLGLLNSQGKNLQLEAVSFSANFDKHTEAMQAIVEAMAEAVDQGMRIDCLMGTANQDQPEAAGSIIKQAHQNLLHKQQLYSVCSFLLRKGDRISGVLTIELDRRCLNADQELLVQQATHSMAAIIVLQQHANAGLWQGLKQRMLARLQRWLGTQAWRGKLVAGALIILLVALFVPVNYQLSADAILQTTEKYLVVSPQDAYLGEIIARPGDSVTKGEVLAQLNDEDLRLERRKIASQAQQYRQAYDSALANSNRVEAAIANAQLEQANIQVQLLDQQLTRSQLLAPIDGIVVSDDISQTRGAPVKQGDVLFEIAAGNNYLVQLFVDERDIAMVQPGQAGELKLTSLPSEVFAISVTLITPISEIREGRNYFRVELEFVDGEKKTSLLRPGMTGTGKVQTGKRTLGWIWFHDLWYWLRISLW